MNRRGFTLIELLVVIALMAIMTAIALPSVSSYFQVSINSATRGIAGKVKEAYNSTVLTGRVYRLVYDLVRGAGRVRQRSAASNAHQ